MLSLESCGFNQRSYARHTAGTQPGRYRTVLSWRAGVLLRFAGAIVWLESDWTLLAAIAITAMSGGFLQQHTPGMHAYIALCGASTVAVCAKGLAQPHAWNAGDVSASPKQGEACELAGVPRAWQARPLSACIHTKAYEDSFPCWRCSCIFAHKNEHMQAVSHVLACTQAHCCLGNPCSCFKYNVTHSAGSCTAAYLSFHPMAQCAVHALRSQKT
jgi:hypothetical protein